MRHKIFIILSLFFCLFTSCKKLVEVGGPTTSINSANIYEKDATAASVLTGIFINMSSVSVQSQYLTGLSYYAGLSSDELTIIQGLGDLRMNAYHSNNLNNSVGFEFWNNIYAQLYVINSAIEGITNSTTLTSNVKVQLLGEGKFLRALCFFYLVNLYGDVPLILGTDYKVNTLMYRTSGSDVWQQIIKDLNDAKDLLSSNYLDASLLKVTSEKVRPTKWAAIALLARAYLYNEKWAEAEKQSTEILSHGVFQLVRLENVFNKNNLEAIWQLQPVSLYNNTMDGDAFVFREERGFEYTPAIVNKSLMDAFDIGDQRRIQWIKTVDIDGVYYSFPNKYKYAQEPDIPSYEYSTVLRLGEQYLIRAEAKIRQGNITSGIDDLNILRARATDKDAQIAQQLKPLATNLSKDDAIKAVLHERQTELFTEWGHRWLDLKRLGKIDEVMQIELPKKVANATWKSYQQWYPISVAELQSAPNLKQNTGY